MLLKSKNKQYAGTIATIFCEGTISPGLCLVSVKNRIEKSFNDKIFEDSFIPGLSSARFYALSIAHGPSGEGFIKYIIGGFDIVTGKNKTMMIDGIPGGKREDIAWVFNVHLNRYYEVAGIPYHATYLGKVGGKYLLQIAMPNNYGIVFVPGSVGKGGSGGGGGIIVDPPILDPGAGEESGIAGFDFAALLSNPMVLIGGATLLFFYFMND